MKKVLFTFCCFLVTLQTFAQLSDQSTISLLTCEPGPAVYAKFGHTAIRITDPQNDLDIVFHYGVFDFSSDHFIARFVKGETDYQLGALPFRYFMPEYVERNSSVYEQKLNLTLEEKQKNYDALIENYQPENRIYRYNFIYDNCATRPFFLLIRNQAENITFNLPHTQTTYRTIIEEYVGYNNWLRFGIDLVVSSLSDKPIGMMETVAFPLYTKWLIDHAEKTDSVGTTQPMVSETNLLFTATEHDDGNTIPFLLSPIFIINLLALLGTLLAFYEWRTKRYCHWFDAVFFAAIGLIGCVIFFLAFFSIHPIVKENFNLLFCNPLALIATVCLFIKSSYRYLNYYFIFNSICCLCALVVSILQLQLLHAAFIPLIALSIIRSVAFIQLQKSRFHVQ